MVKIDFSQMKPISARDLEIVAISMSRAQWMDVLSNIEAAWSEGQGAAVPEFLAILLAYGFDVPEHIR